MGCGRATWEKQIELVVPALRAERARAGAVPEVSAVSDLRDNYQQPHQLHARWRRDGVVA